MGRVEISFDPALVDFRRTSDLLMASYWGADRSDDGHRRAFANSLCAGAYVDGAQVGFARVVTDYAYFAYLCDVIVWPERRGAGIGKQLIQTLLDHPELAGVSGWSLRTSDAHALYERFGFQVQSDGMYMRLNRHASPTSG